MNLLHDACGSEVELLEIRLHNLLEGENAGSLLGTRTPALFWQHCRRREDASLGRAFLCHEEGRPFQISRFQPFLEHPLFYGNVGYHPLMRNSVKAGTDIAFEYPLCPVVSTQCDETGFHRVCCRATPAEPIRIGVRRGFGDWIEGQQVQGLHSPISHGRNREGPSGTIALGDVHTP